MNKLKYIIIAVIIIIILILSALIYILTTYNNGGELGEDVYSKKDDTINIDIIDKNIKYVDERNEYFTVKQCINQYLDAILKQNAKELYNYLDNEYIKDYDVDSNNVLSKIEEVGKYSSEEIILSINTMYTIKNDNYLRVYFVYGKIGEDYDKLNQEFDVMVRMDKTNDTFSIYPKQYMEDNNYMNLDIGDKIKEDFGPIEKNDNNSFNYTGIDDDRMIREYLSDFTNKMLFYPEEAYQLLDQEYRNKRFPTIEDFKKYIENNEITYIKSHDIKKCSNYTLYICQDNYGKRYIIKEYEIMHYTMQLDDYTIGNDWINDKYDNEKTENKGALNIYKFFQMINNQDYSSAYKVLDSDFKAKNFPTEQDFINYITSKVFKYNEIKIEEYSSQIKGIYVYKIKITDATWEDDKEVELNVIMKVLDDRDFVMSFEIN